MAHKQRIRAIAISPDNQAIASDDQTVKLWDVSSGKCTRTIAGYANSVFTAIFSSNGTAIASGHRDGFVRFWNIQTGKCFAKLFHDQQGVRSTVLHPQQSLFATGGQDGTVRIWHLDTLECIHLLKGHGDRVNALAYC